MTEVRQSDEVTRQKVLDLLAEIKRQVPGLFDDDTESVRIATAPFEGLMSYLEYEFKDPVVWSSASEWVLDRIIPVVQAAKDLAYERYASKHDLSSFVEHGQEFYMGVTPVPDWDSILPSFPSQFNTSLMASVAVFDILYYAKRSDSITLRLDAATLMDSCHKYLYHFTGVYGFTLLYLFHQIIEKDYTPTLEMHVKAYPVEDD